MSSAPFRNGESATKIFMASDSSSDSSSDPQDYRVGHRYQYSYIGNLLERFRSIFLSFCLIFHGCLRSRLCWIWDFSVAPSQLRWLMKSTVLRCWWMPKKNDMKNGNLGLMPEQFSFKLFQTDLAGRRACKYVDDVYMYKYHIIYLDSVCLSQVVATVRSYWNAIPDVPGCLSRSL